MRKPVGCDAGLAVGNSCNLCSVLHQVVFPTRRLFSDWKTVVKLKNKRDVDRATSSGKRLLSARCRQGVDMRAFLAPTSLYSPKRRGAFHLPCASARAAWAG